MIVVFHVAAVKNWHKALPGSIPFKNLCILLKTGHFFNKKKRMFLSVILMKT